MKQARDYLIELYDDYRNNYLTVATFAEHHGLREVEAAFLIDLRDGRAYLYRYRVETDGGRKHEDTRLFCSVACRRSYNA